MALIPPPVVSNPKTGTPRTRVPGINTINPPSSGSSGGSSGGSDWQHLLVRGAEFVIGIVLIWVGIQAVVVKSKPTQTIIQTAGTVAKVVK